MQRRRAGRDARPDYLGQQQQQAGQLNQSNMGGLPPMQPAFSPGFPPNPQQNNNYYQENAQFNQPPSQRLPPRLATPNPQPTPLSNGFPPATQTTKAVDNYDPSWSWGTEESDPPQVVNNGVYNQGFLQNNQYPTPNVQIPNPPVSHSQFSGYHSQPAYPVQQAAQVPKPEVKTLSNNQTWQSGPHLEGAAAVGQQGYNAGTVPYQEQPSAEALPPLYNQFSSYEGYQNPYDHSTYQPQHYPLAEQPDTFSNQGQQGGGVAEAHLSHATYAGDAYYQGSEQQGAGGRSEPPTAENLGYWEASHPADADKVITGHGVQDGGRPDAVSVESDPLLRASEQHENLFQGRKSDFSVTSSMNQQDYEGSVASQQDYYDHQHESFRPDGEVVGGGGISDQLDAMSLTDGQRTETTWENRNGEQHTRTSAVSFALDALDTIPGPRLAMDSDAWSRASTWGSGYDDHPRSILSSPPNELNENNGAKSIERSNSFDGSSIVESYAPGSVDSESLSNARFDDRDSKAVSGRTTPFEENSVSRNLSREPSFDRCSREDASDVVAIPPSSISFHDGFEVMKPAPVTDSTASLVGSQSMLSSMTAGSPYVDPKLSRLESQVTVIDQGSGRVGAERTDAEGSLDSGAAAWPPATRPAPTRIATLDEADGADDAYPQQSRQAAYGQPAASHQKFSRPPSDASRPSPATTPSVQYTQQAKAVNEPASVLRPSYPEGPSYVAEDDGSNSSPSGFSHSASFSRELPPSSQRMVPGMSGVDLGQVQLDAERRSRTQQRRPQVGQPPQRPQTMNLPPQAEPPSVRKISAGSQRLEQPPEGAVEYVQDDRLPLQTTNVETRVPNPPPTRPPAPETDQRLRHSAEPERAPNDQARLPHQPRPAFRGTHGPEGAPAPQPPQQTRLRTPVPFQNIPQNLGPHPDPEGTASVPPIARPAPHPQSYPVHSTPEQNVEIHHARPEGSPFTSVPSRDGNRLGGPTPVDDEPRRYQGSGVGSNGKLNEDSGRVVTGYALNDTTHSMTGDRNLGNPRAAEGPSGAPAPRSALIGSEQDLSSRGEERLDDRRSREPEDRRPRRDRRPRNYDDDDYSDRRYYDDRGRYREHRRYAGEDSDEEVRSYYEDRRDRRRGDRSDRRYGDDELYPPSRSSVIGEDVDRYDARSEYSEYDEYEAGKRRPPVREPYHEDDKSRRRYGSRNDRRDHDRRDRDYYRDRDRDPYGGRRREGGMPHPYGGGDFPMYYPAGPYYDPRYQHYYAQYYAQLYARARPGGVLAPPTLAPTAPGTDERASSRCSTADEARRERVSATGSLSEVGVAVESQERKFFDDVHYKGNFVPDGTLLQLESGLPSHQIPSSVGFMDIGQVYESLPDYEELKSFPGPLVRDQTNTLSLTQFCKGKILNLQSGRSSSSAMVQSRILLWEYLILLLKTNGSPEGADISRLLLHDQDELERHPLEAAETTSQEDILSNDRTLVASKTDDAVKEYKALIQLGCKQKALDLAMKKGLWGHAYTLSLSMDQKALDTVRNKFTSSLSVHDSLQTFYQLESGRQPSACSTLGDERKLSDWKSHLAVILSNAGRHPHLERRSIVAMGDSLAARGDLYASQLCYLVAKVEFGNFSDKASRLTLIGSSKWDQTSSNPSLESIQMTEIYEYAVSLSNPRFCIKPLMVHKFCYAKNLVDHGFLLEAYRYCEALWSAFSAAFVQDDLHLASQVYTLADRLKLNDPSTLVYDEYGNRMIVNPEWLNAFCARLYAPSQSEEANAATWQTEATATIEASQQENEEPSSEFQPPVSAETAVESFPHQPQQTEMQQEQQYPSMDQGYDAYYSSSQPTSLGEEVPGGFYQPQFLSSDAPQAFSPFVPSQSSMMETELRQEEAQQEKSVFEAPAPAPVEKQPTAEEAPKASNKEEDKTKQEKAGFFKFFKFGRGGGPPKAILPDDKKKPIVWDPVKNMWVDQENPEAAELLAKPPPLAAAAVASAAPATATPEAAHATTPLGSIRPSARRGRRVDTFRANDSAAAHPFLSPSGTPGVPTPGMSSTPVAPTAGSAFMFVPSPAPSGENS